MSLICRLSWGLRTGDWGHRDWGLGSECSGAEEAGRAEEGSRPSPQSPVPASRSPLGVAQPSLSYRVSIRRPMADRQTNLLQGTLDLLILKSLALGDLHGLGVARRVEQITRGTFQVKPGSLFPALYRMEEAGWLASSWGASENNRRAKYYTPHRRRAPTARTPRPPSGSASRSRSRSPSRPPNDTPTAHAEPEQCPRSAQPRSEARSEPGPPANARRDRRRAGPRSHRWCRLRHDRRLRPEPESARSTPTAPRSPPTRSSSRWASG